MFDLFRKSEKTKKYFMGAILLFVSASMLLYLVPNVNNGTGTSDVVVAKIGSTEITEAETRKLIQAQTRGRQIPVEIIPNYVPQIIQQMVTDRAMEYEAHKLGIVVSDEDVAEYLRANFAGLFPDGKFVGKDVYAAMLNQQGQGATIDEFETELKRTMLISKLREVAIEGSVVTPAEIEQEYRKKNEQIQLQYVKLAQDKFKKEAEPSADEMQQYFRTNSARYQDPERKNLVLLVADGAKIAQSLNPTDSDLEVAYNQNQGNFRMPERIHERHILLMTQGKPAGDEAKVKAKAEDLVKQLRAGADFAEMAKKYSEDNQGPAGGSAAKGGDLDWVARGQMVPEFEKASFSLKPMVISDPVKTQYGYHIIQVLAHEDARLKPLAEVKDELAKQWKQQRLGAILQKISDKAQSALQKDPDHPEKVAADLGMQVVHADGVGPGQAVPEVGASPDFDQSIATLKKGDVSQAVSPAPNKLVVAEVTAILPAHPATFDEVKTQIHDTMVSGRLAKLVQDKSKELADAAKANGGDLAKAAKAMGLEVKTTEPFKRQGNVDGLGSANYFDDAFKVPAGSVLSPVPMPEGTVVAKVGQHIDADMSKLAEQRDAIRESIKGDRARERNTIFESGLVEELTKQGVVKVHAEVVMRILTSFRAGS
jgi:peptidyl-prolyl cis-trans isomerase D